MELFFVSYLQAYPNYFSKNGIQTHILFISANFLPFRVFVASEGNQATGSPGNKPIGFSLKYFQIGCGDHNTNAEGDGSSEGNN